MDLLIKKVLNIFENDSYAQATFCDLSKAFDCVDHNVLLEKLTYYEVRGSSIKIFESFLTGFNRLYVMAVIGMVYSILSMGCNKA